MIRFGEVGKPVTRVWVLLTYLFTVLAIAWIWAGPVARRFQRRPAGD